MAKAYSREKGVAFCHPYPKGAETSRSKFVGVVRVDEPGLYWIFAELAWSDHYPDEVLFVHVKLTPKKL
jgi:hypothetical protein